LDQLDTKALKRLIDTCRKAGVQEFKGFGVEFKLSDEALNSTPVQRTKAEQKATQVLTTEELKAITAEQLSDDELLFYSSDPRVEGESPAS